MHHYEVKFLTKGGREKIEQFEACDPGNAFARCQKLFPGATMLAAIRDGGFMGGSGRTIFSPPPVQRDPIKEPRPARAPRQNERDGIMPFYDEVIGERL